MLEPRTMRVELEILLAQLGENDTLDYVPVRRDISSDPQDPDDMVHRSLLEPGLLGQSGLSPQDCIIHSTSWRFEADARLVLTYLVYTDHSGFPRGGARRVPLRGLHLATNPDPARPRPAAIHEEQVLAHGLRHLSYLIKNGQFQNTDRLLPRSLSTLQSLETTLAGRFQAQQFRSTTACA